MTNQSARIDLVITYLSINYIKSWLFIPADQQVKDLKDASFSKFLKENKEKDAPTLAVNKRFLEFSTVAVDKCEDKTNEISKVDKDFKTTVNQEDVSG